MEALFANNGNCLILNAVFNKNRNDFV